MKSKQLITLMKLAAYTLPEDSRTNSIKKGKYNLRTQKVLEKDFIMNFYDNDEVVYIDLLEGKLRRNKLGSHSFNCNNGLIVGIYVCEEYVSFAIKMTKYGYSWIMVGNSKINCWSSLPEELLNKEDELIVDMINTVRDRLINHY